MNPTPDSPNGAVGLEGQRERFDIPDSITYLNCASMAPQLRAVREAGQAALSAGDHPWEMAPSDWFAPGERLRALFARLVNGDPDGVALVPSASYGIAVAAANVKVDHGQSIVVMDREFPSNVYAWRALAARRGASLRTVGREGGATWGEAIVRAIDQTTAVVAVANCHWIDGTVVDLGAVSRAARVHGAALVVDASQSVGAYPLDVDAVRPDFVVSVGYKWLLGPYGLAYLYTSPARRNGTPIEHSWLTRAGSEDFSRLTEYTTTFRPGSRRFDMGGFPQFVLTPMAIAALEQVLTWRVERLHGTLSRLTAQVLDELEGCGLPVPRRTDVAGHMVGIRVGASDIQGVVADLVAARVYVGVRGDTLRVSPHLYNDRRDIARLAAIVRRRGRRP
jgi:selenocysteine lyase/cysteine desulfurase